MTDWLLRPYPHDKLRTDEFRQRGVVAIGWPFTGDARLLTSEALRASLEHRHSSWTSKRIDNGAECIWQFCHEMQLGDLVLVVPQKKDFNGRVLLAEITGEYEYDASLANNREGYPHLRSVRWVRPQIGRENLPTELDSALGMRGLTLAKIPDDMVRSHALSVGWLS